MNTKHYLQITYSECFLNVFVNVKFHSNSNILVKFAWIIFTDYTAVLFNCLKTRGAPRLAFQQTVMQVKGKTAHRALGENKFSSPGAASEQQFFTDRWNKPTDQRVRLVLPDVYSTWDFRRERTVQFARPGGLCTRNFGPVPVPRMCYIKKRTKREYILYLYIYFITAPG